MEKEEGTKKSSDKGEKETKKKSKMEKK